MVIIIATFVVVLMTFFISGRLEAPDGAGRFKDGQDVALKGQLVCLPHRDQSGSQTLECAYGFLAETGIYYAVKDSTPQKSMITGVPMNQEINIEGIYSPEGDEKYQQNGTIDLKAVIE